MPRTKSRPVNGIYAALDKAGVTGHTTKAVADAVGVSTLTITRWRRAGLLKPEPFHFGKAVAYIFSDADIEAAKEVKKRMHAGRRPTDDESVRVTKPPKTNAAALARLAKIRRQQRARKELASARKTISTDHVPTDEKEAG